MWILKIVRNEKKCPIQVAVASFGLRFGRNEIKLVDEHVYIRPGTVLLYDLFECGSENIKSGFWTGFLYMFSYTNPYGNSPSTPIRGLSVITHKV